MEPELVRNATMKEAPPVWMNGTAGHSADSTRGTVHLDMCSQGIVVLDGAGRVISANMEARKLLRAESATLEARLGDVVSASADVSGSGDETILEIPGVGPIGVRMCAVAGVEGEGHVLLLRDARSLAATANLLQEASRHRASMFLARDWAHDLKGMLHVIRINTALLGRLLQRTPGAADAAVSKCLEALPREVERLDRSIDVMFGARTDEQQSTFDVGRLCERLRSLIAARATRQHVEVVLELQGGSKDVVGFENQVQCALMNVVLNALEAMPDQGRLVISVGGDAGGVTVRVSDTGPGMPPRPDDFTWRPRMMTDRQRAAIGLHVAGAIVESHNGRIECASNVPCGTSVEITFPSAASTERLRHGSRTHR
jgi:signal transduction histidine kinase